MSTCEKTAFHGGNFLDVALFIVLLAGRGEGKAHYDPGRLFREEQGGSLALEGGRGLPELSCGRGPDQTSLLRLLLIIVTLLG